MDNRRRRICIDSSILIDYFRKQNRQKSVLADLQVHYEIALPIIVEYEIYRGSNAGQKMFWDDLLQQFIILPFDDAAKQEAITIFKNLRSKNKLIGEMDILIAATAKAQNLKLATINERHFSRMEGLELIVPKQLGFNE